MSEVTTLIIQCKGTRSGGETVLWIERMTRPGKGTLLFTKVTVIFSPMRFKHYSRMDTITILILVLKLSALSLLGTIPKAIPPV